MKIKIKQINKWVYWSFWIFSIEWIFVEMIMANNAKIGWLSFIFYLPYLSAMIVFFLFKPDGKLGVVELIESVYYFIRGFYVAIIGFVISGLIGIYFGSRFFSGEFSFIEFFIAVSIGMFVMFLSVSYSTRGMYGIM